MFSWASRSSQRDSSLIIARTPHGHSLTRLPTSRLSEEQTVRTPRTPAGSLLDCVQTDGLDLVASYEDVQCWGPKDCFTAYYAIMLRQERYAEDKWTTVLKLVRVTTRWGGIENVFTMKVHF